MGMCLASEHLSFFLGAAAAAAAGDGDGADADSGADADTALAGDGRTSTTHACDPGCHGNHAAYQGTAGGECHVVEQFIGTPISGRGVNKYKSSTIPVKHTL